MCKETPAWFKGKSMKRGAHLSPMGVAAIMSLIIIPTPAPNAVLAITLCQNIGVKDCVLLGLSSLVSFSHSLSPAHIHIHTLTDTHQPRAARERRVYPAARPHVNSRTLYTHTSPAHPNPRQCRAVCVGLTQPHLAIFHNSNEHMKEPHAALVPHDANRIQMKCGGGKQKQSGIETGGRKKGVPYWPVLNPATKLIVIFLQPRNNPGGGSKKLFATPEKELILNPCHYCH
jgi:hypothetical protein